MTTPSEIFKPRLSLLRAWRIWRLLGLGFLPGFLLLSGGGYLAAQTADSFNPRLSGGNVCALAPQGDGKILVGGYFYMSIWGQLRDRSLARFNADGTLDSSLGPAGTILSLAVAASTAALIQGLTTPCFLWQCRPTGRFWSGATSPLWGGRFAPVSAVSTPTGAWTRASTPELIPLMSPPATSPRASTKLLVAPTLETSDTSVPYDFFGENQ